MKLHLLEERRYVFPYLCLSACKIMHIVMYGFLMITFLDGWVPGWRLSNSQVETVSHSFSNHFDSLEKISDLSPCLCGKQFWWIHAAYQSLFPTI